MSILPNLKHILPENEQPDDLNHEMPILDLTAKRLIDDRVSVEIQNVVASANLNQHLDLDVILQVTPGAKYNQERFPGLVYRLKRPKTTTLLFRSGKMICTGAKSTRSANTAITQVINALKDQGIVIITTPTPKIENIVASGDLGGTIDLENVAERLFKTMYEPEQFPGLIYRMDDPKTVFLIFANGKIVCTGTKTETGLNSAIHNLIGTLQLNNLIMPHNDKQVQRDLQYSSARNISISRTGN
ncbi:MAG TPA: TATA-box-binding protein [Candidatus Bathyarchaeia archaeon]|nr:TATA-box-binding protein [Candidatus Bathyarchaeia archaeon]